MILQSRNQYEKIDFYSSVVVSMNDSPDENEGFSGDSPISKTNDSPEKKHSAEEAHFENE